MRITDNIQNLALATLERGVPKTNSGSFCIPIADTKFFVAEANYPNVIAYGAIEFDGKEYKIGPMRTE